MRSILLVNFLLFMFYSISISVSTEKEGVKILKLAMKRWEKIKDCKYSFTYIEVKDEKEEKNEYLFSFMKDTFRRLEGIEGENKGTIVVYNPDENKEKVRVKRGFLPLTLDKDNERLTGFFAVDWGSHLAHLSKYIKHGNIKFIRKGEIQGREVITFEFTPIKKMEYTKEIVSFDVKENVLVQIERYKENKFHSKIIFKDFSINSGLKPEDFKI